MVTNCVLILHGVILEWLVDSARRKDLRRGSVPWSAFLVWYLVVMDNLSADYVDLANFLQYHPDVLSSDSFEYG